MGPSITSWSQVAGVAALTLLATSVPPSARPTAPLVMPEATEERTEGTLPADVPVPDESPARPMAVISVDLGNVWVRASTAAAENGRGRPAPRPLADSMQSDGGSDGFGLVDRGLITPQTPNTPSRWAFLTAARPHAPPIA